MPLFFTIMTSLEDRIKWNKDIADTIKPIDFYKSIMLD